MRYPRTVDQFSTASIRPRTRLAVTCSCQPDRLDRPQDQRGIDLVDRQLTEHRVDIGLQRAQERFAGLGGFPFGFVPVVERLRGRLESDRQDGFAGLLNAFLPASINRVGAGVNQLLGRARRAKASFCEKTAIGPSPIQRLRPRSS